MATKSDEPEVIQAPADKTIVVLVTGAIYHNGNQKPTERWCFEIGLRMIGDGDFASILNRSQKGFGIKEKMCNAQHCQVQNSTVFKRLSNEIT